MTILQTLRHRAKALKQEILTLYCTLRHPNTPRLARWLAYFVLAYALSPIDLIPDVIPVLGYLDDLLLLPIAITLVLKLIPPEVLSDCRTQAAHLAKQRLSKSKLGLALVISTWLGLAWLLVANV